MVKAVKEYDDFDSLNSKTFSKPPKKYNKKDLEVARESYRLLSKIGNYGAAYIVKNKIAENWYKNEDGTYDMNEAKRYFLEESDPVIDKTDFRDPKIQKQMADAYYEIKTSNKYSKSLTKK